MRVDIVRRRLAHTFQILPADGWWSAPSPGISKHRRTVRDYERLPDHHQAMVTWR